MFKIYQGRRTEEKKQITKRFSKRACENRPFFIVLLAIANYNSLMNKYRNIKTETHGIRFDSKKEAERFLQLQLLERAGNIKNLERQKRFEICPKRYENKRARYYVADFVYIENGKKIIEDVKSPITRKNPVYSLKKALVQVNYPEYVFKET